MGISCVILLLMKCVAPFGLVWFVNSNLTDEALSIHSFLLIGQQLLCSCTNKFINFNKILEIVFGVLYNINIKLRRVTMRIYQANDYREISLRGADLISAQILIKPNSVLGLATGASPIGIYDELVRRNNEGFLDFSEVKTINLDEYKGITRDNDQSYYYFMHDHLFSHVNIKEENVHIPSGMAVDSAAECARYDKIISDLGGADIQLLGIGQNGHIGFNEPDDVFAGGTHCVSLTPSTIAANSKYFGGEDKTPKSAFTMGIKGIMQAKKILLIANGESKAKALAGAICGPISSKLPASVLQLHPDVTVIADAAALSLVK